ncbi:MAG: T9SS type A sorting domain-containing protein [Chitinophagaceae bacterium]
MKQLIFFLSILLCCTGVRAQRGCSGASIVVSGRVLECDLKMYAYRWVNCADLTKELTDAFGQLYYVPEDGDYAVIVTKGACTDTLDCVSVSVLGIAENKQSPQISIFPNPSSGILHIQNTRLQGDVTAVVTDLTGRHISQHQLFFKNGTSSLEVSLPPAAYLLYLRNPGLQQTVVPFVIQ